MNLALHRHALVPAAPLRLGDRATSPPDGLLFTVPGSYLTALCGTLQAARAADAHGAFSWLDAAERSLARLLDFYGWAIAPEARRCTARVVEVQGACAVAEVFADFGRRHRSAGARDSQSLIALTAPLLLTRGPGRSTATLEPGYGVLLQPAAVDTIEVAPPSGDRALCAVVSALAT